MPELPLPPAVREMLGKPNPAVITTLQKSGQPVSVATWYLLDGDRIVVNMDESRVRLKHIRNDPRVSLTATDADNWYTHVSIVGHVVDIRPDEDLSGIDAQSIHYGGKPYPTRDSPRWDAWIEIDRWHAWGALKDA